MKMIPLALVLFSPFLFGMNLDVLVRAKSIEGLKKEMAQAEEVAANQRSCQFQAKNGAVPTKCFYLAQAQKRSKIKYWRWAEELCQTAELSELTRSQFGLVMGQIPRSSRCYTRLREELKDRTYQEGELDPPGVVVE